jgi:hypothetical protein
VIAEAIAKLPELATGNCTSLTGFTQELEIKDG